MESSARIVTRYLSNVWNCLMDIKPTEAEADRKRRLLLSRALTLERVAILTLFVGFFALAFRVLNVSNSSENVFNVVLSIAVFGVFGFCIYSWIVI